MEERKKEKKENSTELQKPNVEAEVYNNKKSDWEKNRKRKSSVSFHSASVCCNSAIFSMNHYSSMVHYSNDTSGCSLNWSTTDDIFV